MSQKSLQLFRLKCISSSVFDITFTYPSVQETLSESKSLWWSKMCWNSFCSSALLSYTVLIKWNEYPHCVAATVRSQRWHTLSSSLVHFGDLEKNAARQLRWEKKKVCVARFFQQPEAWPNSVFGHSNEQTMAVGLLPLPWLELHVNQKPSLPPYCNTAQLLWKFIRPP